MMLTTKRFLSWIDIAPHEVPRVLVLFLVTLSFMTAHVIGHAYTLAAVTESFGSESLPFFFIVQAVVAMCGTLIFGRFVSTGNHSSLFLLQSCLAGVILVAAYLFADFVLVFYPFLLVVLAILQVQLHTVLALLKEHAFTPLESQRTFPIIESAENFAGLLGGGLVSLFASVLHLNDFLLLWALFFFLSLAIWYGWQVFQKQMPTFGEHHHTAFAEHKPLFLFLQDTFRLYKKDAFLVILAAFVFFQYGLAQVFDVFYTTVLSSAHAVESSGGHGSSVLHGLGVYVSVVSAIVILLQMFFARTIVRFLGVVRNMLLMPVVTLASATSFLFLAVPLSAALTKGAFDISRNMAKNTYLSSLYVLPEAVRLPAKPFLDGFFGPAATVFVTSIMIAIEWFFHDPVSRQYGMIALFVTLLVFLLFLLIFGRRVYTDYASKNVKSATHDLSEQLSFIEILGQRGHDEKAFETLIAHLRRTSKRPIRHKILHTLGELSLPLSLPYLLDVLDRQTKVLSLQDVTSTFDPEEVFLTLRAMNRLDIDKEKFRDFAFGHHRSVQVLRELFLKTSSQEVQLEILRFFSRIQDLSFVPFLLETLHNATDADFLAQCISALESFDDPNIVSYLLPFTKHPDPLVCAHAISAVWKFPAYRLELFGPIALLHINASDRQMQAFAFMTGKTQAKQEEFAVQELLSQESPLVRLFASWALLRLGNTIAEEMFFSYLLSDDMTLSHQAKELLQELEVDLKREYSQKLHHIGRGRIWSIVSQYGHSLDKIPLAELESLGRWYFLLDRDKELHSVREQIEKKQREESAISATSDI